MQPIHINLFKGNRRNNCGQFLKRNKKERLSPRPNLQFGEKNKWYARLGVGLYSAFKGAPLLGSNYMTSFSLSWRVVVVWALPFFERLAVLAWLVGLASVGVKRPPLTEEKGHSKSIHWKGIFSRVVIGVHNNLTINDNYFDFFELSYFIWSWI